MGNSGQLKYLTSAYELLQKYLTKSGRKNTEEFYEIKEIGYIIVFKMIKIWIDKRKLEEAVKQFRTHIKNTKGLTTLRDLCFLHYKHMALLYSTMGRLIQKFFKGTQIPYPSDWNRH